MQNIDVRFNASSNFGKVKGDLAALQAQASALGNVFAKSAYAKQPALVNPAAWKQSTRAVHEASNAFRNAASSSGLFNTQQIRATSEANKYTQALQKQKLTLGEMRKHRGIMKEVYNDQLRMQRMTAQTWGTDSAGRHVTDVVTPKNAPRDLDRLAQKTYFAGQMAKSAGTQVVNMGKNMQWAGRQLTVGLTYPVVLFGAAAAVMSYKVDTAMTRVTKVYDISAEAQRNEAMRTKELNDVRTKSWAIAGNAAKDYGMRIEDTLEIEQRLAATGLKGEQLFQSTKQVSRIATLGDLDIGASTDMAIALQNAFKDTIKDADDLTETFDYMNAVENATSLSLQDIAEATPRAAAGLAGLGVTAKEMTVMLVAMREKGVNAAQGANALKSATTRILNPVKKATDYYSEYGIALESVSKQSGGNLFEFLKLLSVEQSKIVGNTVKETNRLRQKGVATLFGTYQFNRLNAALVGVGEAVSGTGNAASQTTKAYKLLGAGAEDLAKTAEQELAQKMEATSGKFKAALETMRIELAKAGEPFLRVITSVVKGLGGILGFFNQMSDFKKKAILFSVALAAIAGPIIMLGGLFMNLAGHFMKGIGGLMSGFSRMAGAVRLVTLEEKAATLATNAQNTAMAAQQAKTVTLAQEIRVLAAAYLEATKAANAYAGTANKVSNISGHAGKAVPAVYGPHTQTLTGKGFSTPYQMTGKEQGYYSATSTHGSTRTGNAGFLSQETRLMQARNKLAMDYMRTNNQVARDATFTQKRLAAQARTTATIQNNMNGAAIAGGVMAVSMAVMMSPANETTKNIAKWTMIGALVVPALASMVVYLNQGVTRAWAIAAASLVSERSIQRSAAGAGALAVGLGVATGTARGLAVALNTALGPIGWIALGLTAIAGTIMVIKNHNDKIREEQAALIEKQREANKTMLESTRSIATELGKAAGSYGDIIDKGGEASSGADRQERDLQRSFEYYRGEEGSKESAALQDNQGNFLKLGESNELMTKLRAKFISLQVLGNDTAKQARTDIQAMMLAAGAGPITAEKLATSIFEAYGSVKSIDWTKPIKDQSDALSELANKTYELKTTMDGVTSSGGIVGGLSSAKVVLDWEIDEGQMKLLKDQAVTGANFFKEALSKAANPAEARKIINEYMNAATSKWDEGFEQLMAIDDVRGIDEVKALFRDAGITSGKEFAAAMREDGEFEAAYANLIKDSDIESGLRANLDYVKRYAIEYEHIMIGSYANVAKEVGSSVLTAATALEQLASKGIGLNAKKAADDLLENNDAYREFVQLRMQMFRLGEAGVPKDSKQMLSLQTELNASGKRLTKVINELNQEYGFKQGKDSTEALDNLMNRVKDTTKGAGKEADGLNKKLKALDNVSVEIKVKQTGDIINTAMSAVQERMASSAMDAFNKGWDSRIGDAQSAWDSRMDGLSASHERASDKMDASQERASEAFDNRWERRREAVEKAYQHRIDRTKREIESEQRADETRTRLFEKEKARLAELARLENANIDFNTALNEGKLDEAAKVLNNTSAESGNAQMEAEQKAAEQRTQAKIRALEKKNERLEKARDKEIENLEKLEERMRKHLERVQEARRKALERQQKDEVKALEKSEAAAMDSLDTQRDYEEATLQQRLDLFVAYTAKNKKDLERWMKVLGFEYDDFGRNIEKKGQSWAKSIKSSLLDEIKEAGTKVMNDNYWEKVGKSISNKLIKGLGFNGITDFRQFVKTGEMGKGNGKGKGGQGDIETRHEGGMIGSGSGSRGSIPNTYKGLHRSEKMVRAQKGEYVINKKSARQNMGILDQINKGSDITPPTMGGMAAGDSVNMSSAGYGGPVGLIAGVVSKMFASGVGKAYNNAYQSGKAKQQTSFGPGGVFGATAGTYGGRAFSIEQMRNAATIASVGSGMGMSKRDIEIGIMTAIAESGLVNIHGGDRDSQGLFQQRPSMGWGTVAQVTDPQYAARAFFGPLKAHEERNSETPWMAAQHIQRSAFSDGSNYRVWWEAAQQILNSGLKKKSGPNGTMVPGGGYVAGKGGKHRPINAPAGSNIHGGSTSGNPPALDFSAPSGRPVYAISDGVITSSRDIAGPLSSDRYRGDGPYGSFGRVIQMRTDSGVDALYAHLSRRSVGAGTRVKGGSTIGYSGNTGNSSGPHLHFGATNGPYAWLRKGGTIKHDETPAMLHRGETVLTDSLTRQFKDNVATGSTEGYNVTIDLRGSYIKEDVDIEKAVNKAIDTREQKVGRKRVVR